MADLPGLPFDEAPMATPEAAATVSELTARLKALVERAFATVRVEGEISNFRRWSSGHLYFTLKDDHAQIRAVMFRTAARRLTFAPEDGMRVVAAGRVSVYEVKGDYQIICDSLEPHGLGALQAAFDELKRRLHAEGLFAPERKRPIPVLPRRIGVVTSLDGAAVRDVLKVLTSRYPGARILIRPSRVQGEGAAADLARGLVAVAAAPDIDVVILGRGGGSAEDLQAFNDERLARAIATCPVPVISAVGHEVDVTIADFVADVRAATPSNAAEIVVDRAENFVQRVERLDQRLRRSAAAAIERRTQARRHLDLRVRQWPTGVVLRQRDLDEQGLRLRQAMLGRVAALDRRFDALRRRLERRDLRRVVSDIRLRLKIADQRLRERMLRRRLASSAHAAALAGRLDALSPLSVLGRGYAVCWNEARTSIIRSAKDVERGDVVRVSLAEGELGCRVDDVSDTTPDPGSQT